MSENKDFDTGMERSERKYFGGGMGEATSNFLAVGRR